MIHVTENVHFLIYYLLFCAVIHFSYEIYYFYYEEVKNLSLNHANSGIFTMLIFEVLR